MIERYEVPEVSAIWSEENKYRKWLDVELAITETWAQMGEVPKKSLDNIRRNARFDSDRILEIEKKVKHDVIAFLTSVEESIGEDSAYIHKGITSYDVVDTALSLLIRESLAVVEKKSSDFTRLLLAKAFAYKDLVEIGRTHGIHAEPITFGVKFLIWYEEMRRNLERLKRAEETISVGKISGSVGTYIHFPPEGEEETLARLGLKPCRVSSQIIQRDRHAEVLSALALLGTTLEKIAVEIRHLQKTEVLEVEEPFSRGQKGSSSMPHNILWHERDISHSAAERIILPDSFHLAAFMLDDILDVIGNLNVYPENMRRNLEITGGVCYSQKVLTLLVSRGMGRQLAYGLVQKHAMASWLEKRSFRESIFSDPDVRGRCSVSELEKAFSEKDLLSGIGKIFRRFSSDRRRYGR